MELLLALPPERITQGDRYGLLPVRMAYRIGPGPRLLCARGAQSIRGGYLAVDCTGLEASGDPLPCARQILMECKQRCAKGIVLDAEGLPNGCIGPLVSLLDHNCCAHGWTLYVPESFAPFTAHARILISSAITRGTLERRLRTAAEQYGTDRTALAVEWMRQDFLLPASGPGEPISQELLDSQLRRLEPAVFLDRGLCAHYFTYMVRRIQAHFVLFDSPASVREKLSAAQRVGIAAVLLPGPEIEPHLEEIFGPV